MKARATLIVIVLCNLNGFVKSDVILPHVEDFEGFLVGSTFEGWGVPFGQILGSDSRPFGVELPFTDNYLFMSDSQGQSAHISFSEITDTVDLSLDFCSLPNPQYNPTGAFRGGASFFLLGDSAEPRSPRLGITIDGEMHDNPDGLEVRFAKRYFGGVSETTVLLGTLGHGDVYHLNISLEEDKVSILISGESTSLTYEHMLNEILPVEGVEFWEGSYPSEEYGLGIDNIIVIPEPASFFLFSLAATLCISKKGTC